jgi:hypothetical protein
MYQDTGRSLEPRSLNSLDVNADALVRTGGTDLARHDAVASVTLPPPDDWVDSIAQINALGHVIPPDGADLHLDQKYRTSVYALNQRTACIAFPCLVCGKNYKQMS